jgi:hypothetical protein
MSVGDLGRSRPRFPSEESGILALDYIRLAPREKVATAPLDRSQILRRDPKLSRDLREGEASLQAAPAERPTGLGRLSRRRA